uniref:Uncharacterized protein n=2 Tax=Aegilops tauschii subsp. strangulata TaxID=200361 RepID=A0A453Q4Z7_AEGTS
CPSLLRVFLAFALVLARHHHYVLRMSLPKRLTQLPVGWSQISNMVMVTNTNPETLPEDWHWQWPEHWHWQIPNTYMIHSTKTSIFPKRTSYCHPITETPLYQYAGLPTPALQKAKSKGNKHFLTFKPDNIRAYYHIVKQSLTLHHKWHSGIYWRRLEIH